jgi:hypothetical protein
MADTELTKVELSQFIIPNDASVCLLECKKAFEALTAKEKLYAHHLSRADWYGSLICLLQVRFHYLNHLGCTGLISG